MAKRLKNIAGTLTSPAVFIDELASFPSTQLQATRGPGDFLGSLVPFCGRSIPILESLQGRKIH